MVLGIRATAGATAVVTATNELALIRSKLEDFWAVPTGTHNIIALDSKGKDNLKAADIREV